MRAATRALFGFIVNRAVFKAHPFLAVRVVQQANNNREVDDFQLHGNRTLGSRC